MAPNIQKSDPASGTRKRTASHLPAFDTIQAVQHLKDAGFGEKQAMIMVETLRDVQSELATKSNLERTEGALRGDMEKMETGIRGDMEKMETGIRGDMEKMEAGIRSDMEKMEFNLRADTMALRNEMNDRFATLYWHLLLGASVMTGILGTLITLTGAR